MVISSVEDFASKLDALAEVAGLLQVNELSDSLESFEDSRGGAVLLELSEEHLLVLKEGRGIGGSVGEELVELSAGPLDAMLDLVGEVSQGAHGDGLFRRILGIAVALSLVGHNHLRVSLGAESTRLKERLLVPDATGVDVETSVDVIDSVNNEVKTFPEFVVEDRLGVGANSGHVVLNIKIRVHCLCNSASSLRLGVTNVVLAEQELTVQVGDLDVIVVSDGDVTALSATETHQSKGLDVLASKSTSTNHESLNLQKLVLDFTTEDLDLVIVSAVSGSSVNLTLGESLEGVVVQPLLQGSVLSGVFHDFLGDDTSEESGLGRDGARGETGSVNNHILVDLLNEVLLSSLASSVDLVGSGQHSLEVSSSVLGVSAVLALESVDGSDAQVKLVRATPLGKVRSHQHALG